MAGVRRRMEGESARGRNGEKPRAFRHSQRALKEKKEVNAYAATRVLAGYIT